VALPRELSDHPPIILSTVRRDFGPPPFRFYNSWILRDGFENFVINTWRSFEGWGPPDRLLLNKLKFLKEEIKSWRRIEHEKETKDITDLRKVVSDLDLAAESRTLDSDELNLLRNSKLKIVEQEKLDKMDLMQKSKVR